MLPEEKQVTKWNAQYKLIVGEIYAQKTPGKNNH